MRAARYSEFRCKSCYQRGSPQGLASKSEEAMMTPTEVISDAILFVYPLRRALAKVRAYVTRNRTICAKNSTFGYFDGINPVTVTYPDYDSWKLINLKSQVTNHLLKLR